MIAGSRMAGRARVANPETVTKGMPHMIAPAARLVGQTVWPALVNLDISGRVCATEGPRMRSIIVAVIAVFASLPQSASAQSVPVVVEAPPVPLAPGEIANYCVYESRIYSIGSGLCFGRVGYVCVPPTGPATGNRSFWTSKEDQVFPRPTCN
jgi:hypothetical protein